MTALAPVILIHGPVGNSPPVAGQAGDPIWVSSATIVDSNVQFHTNTVTVNAGDLVIVAVALYQTTAAESTNQLDGVDMTVAAYTNSYNNATKGFYVAYKLAAASGNSSVIINSGSAPAEKSCVIEVYRNVHQTTPVGTAVVSDVSSITGATNTCNSATGDLIYDAITWNVGAVGSVGSGQTRRGTADPGADDASVATSNKSSEGATSTMRESGWASGRIGHIVFAIKHQ